MFSGIVEEYATVVALVKDQENIHFTLKCSFVNELKIDQSISHNGVCLTVVSMTEDTYTVTAMKETLDRSNLRLLKVGDKVNVERSMMMNGRLDGHIVQGHVIRPPNVSISKMQTEAGILRLNMLSTRRWPSAAILRSIRVRLRSTVSA